MDKKTKTSIPATSYYYAVRGQDYGTCETLRWAYTSIRPYLLAEGDDEEDVLERAMARAGEDVRTHERVGIDSLAYKMTARLGR